ncbi:hypothetical protein [Runella zeae]|uniref:hypothetical protein n=1 Tax=Runella zeae TaxID=94255 RepID=UPI00040F5736|nr:hypothetical protein [Runella zeae]
MKRRDFLKKLGLKSGLDQTELDDILNNLDGDEIDDIKADAAIKAVYTSDEALGNDDLFKKVTSKAKAEALNPIDTILKAFESKLKAEEKAEYNKLDTSHKKYNYMLKVFAERETPTGDANYDSLKSEYETLKSDVDTKYVKKEDYETVSQKATKAMQGAFKTKLSIAAAKKIGDAANARHFEENFFNDASELVATTGIGKSKVKGVIDYETGKIMRADSPDQPIMLDGKVVTIADLADLTIEHFEYKAPVSNPASAGRIVITGQTDDATKDSNASARTRNLDMDSE